MEHVVLDIETTGLSRYTNRITEIAAIKLKNDKIVDKFHSLINPEQHIPRFITRLTGIDDNMVEDAPKIKEVLPNFKPFLSDYPIVAHNAGFDFGFLEHNFQRHLNHQLNNKLICTMRLANRIPIDFKNKKLQTLCDYFRIKNESQHRAMGDAMATVLLLQNFKNILAKNNISTIEDIHKFSIKSAQKCRSEIRL
ncbi:MAG: PolC-type DNA polymerase III [Candidatus Woesearchaeota archaeon]